MNTARRGAYPITANDPIVFEIMNKAEEKKISILELSKRSGIGRNEIGYMRHPRKNKSGMSGHAPKLYQVQALAGVFGLELKLVSKVKK